MTTFCNCAFPRVFWAVQKYESGKFATCPPGSVHSAVNSTICRLTKRGTPCGMPLLSVHQNIEILNLWEDFKKVVKFIDDNFEWLNPLMESITKKKLSLE